MTLSGKAKTGADLRFSLFSLAGNKTAGSKMLSIDPRQLSDIDAGVWFLNRLTKEYPDLTWDELLNPSKLSGWATDTKNFFGGVVSDTAGLIGRNVGDAVRLAADPKVVDAVGKYAETYTKMQTGGMTDIFSSFGQSAKKNFSDPNLMLYGILGVTAIMALIILTKKKAPNYDRQYRRY